MTSLHHACWPAGLPTSLTLPATSVYVNLMVSALRYPDKAALIFYDTVLTYRQLHEEVLSLAGYLQKHCGVRRGDRVLLDMQNSPQWVIAYFAVLRADAMVVPVNPMLLTDELRHYVDDSGARLAFASQEISARLEPMLGAGTLQHMIVATYADYLRVPTTLTVPDQIAAPRIAIDIEHQVAWDDAIKTGGTLSPHLAGPDDLACMPYTSGTTGQPKGCVHTHRSVMFACVAGPLWSAPPIPDQVALAVLPFFHVTGMQVSMNATIFGGGTLVILPRWDRDVAGQLITRYGVTTWTNIPTMVIDFLANPRLAEYDLRGLRRIAGGGAAMPAAVAQKLFDLTGLHYMEGFGLSETMATTHSNPPQAMKQQCLGIPIFDVDSRIVDPITLVEVPRGEQGEILIHGPQVMREYWNDAAKTAAAFIEIDGKRFLRTGDLGYQDEQGYFFFTDRLKRMINASGYKVWPAEIESMMYRHPAIAECCVIASRDSYRGETVKAVVVLRPDRQASADDIMQWAHAAMAAYKVPRLIEFVSALPKSATGKIMWRALQEKEFAADSTPSVD